MRTFRSIWTANLGIAAALACVANVEAAESARLSAFRQGDQTSYAVSLAPEMANKEVDGVDVVVLFDTSASQQGAYRETALQALKSLAAGLRPTDRIQIVAVDLDARDVTADFVAGNDAAVASAVDALSKQAPLGSTDVEAGLTAAIAKFDAAKSANRAILYIGDGASMANLLDAPTMGPLVEKLRAARAPMSSYAIGPQVDAELLAVLANQSGGNLYVAEPIVWQDEAAGVDDARAREENVRNAQNVGKNLANWSRAAVAWPTKAQIPSELGQSYPTAFPPLRADRDTVIVGRTPAEISKPANVEVSAVGADGKSVDFVWTVQPEAANNDNAYLAAIVDGASRNGGLTLPTLGAAGLTEVARMMGAQTDQLTQLAQRAVATGDREGALQIVQAVLRRDPGNVQARTVQTAIESAPAGNVDPFPTTTVEGPAVGAPAAATAPALGGDIILNRAVNDAPIPPAEPGLLERRGPDGAFLDEVEQERRAYSQMLEAEVANTVIDARERMAAEPQIAIQELKLSLENIRRAAELDAPTRAALEDKLSIALREATRKASLKDELDRLRDEELAAVRDQKFLDAQLMRRIEREKQLMDRFNALMDERRYVEAEEVAAIVEEIDPNGVTPRVAALWARHTRHHYLQQVARSARHNATWDTFYQIELSGIPFPDNPPIVYPDAPVWEELTKRRKDRYAVDLKSEGEAERRIYSALRQPLRAPLSFVAQPLSDVVRVLSEDYDIPIIIDTTALDAVASSPDVEITIEIGNVTLKSALELLLKSAGEGDLTYIVDNEVLMITTQEEAEKRLQVKVYPVADLVLPIINLGGMGGMGGMMGGGGGGMMGGGGMGGGGMGGMGGGGMGGMGGGGGGMGGGGGGFFAVPDDITLKPAVAKQDAAPASAAPAEPQAAPSAAPKVPGIEIDLSATPEAFWSKYFSEKQQDEAVVRRAAKLLIKQKHYDHAIALIQAALSHGQPQSWMYESLGIALELDGRPKAEIERAVMSACDFSTNPQELMLIARYLSHIGLDQRAVDVYRQVAKVAPLEQDAYTYGLRAAQRANDADGIRWAAVGIIKQAWPTEQQEIRNTAMRIAQATLDELQAAGNTEAAETFRRELDEALVRDCVVKVSWSGDADVDLVVEEPSGSVCSLRVPRSAGGGVVLGDDYANFEKNDQAGAFSETYVCPQGFPGEYRIRVRKVWGDVVADRVTVDVYKNYRAKNEQHERQHIAVTGDDDSLVVFNLEQGRRNDPIEAQQLVASVDRQQAISQAVMAQQLGSISDPSILPGRSESDPFDLRRQLALARGGGAVGYQPVIITLPEGRQMIATAVVSADRRYVRITAAPSFTGIGAVQTFTFAGSSTAADEEDEDNADNADTADNADGGGNGGNGGGDFADF